MKSSSKIEKFQIAVEGTPLRLIKDQWLPVAAFVALTLPLTLVQPAPQQTVNAEGAGSTAAAIATSVAQSVPFSVPAPLPQPAAKGLPATAAAHKHPHRILNGAIRGA